MKRFWNKVNKTDSCWLWIAYLNNKGYGCFSYKGKRILSHRFSWILKNGIIPKHKSYHGLCVLHKCDNPACVNPKHLFIGTHKENVKDRIKKGRSARLIGEKNGCSILTEKQVNEIRNKYIPYKYSYRQLGKEYNVDFTTIYLIIKRKNWKHL